LLVVGRELFGIPFHPTVGGDATVAAAMQRWFDRRETTTSWSSSAAEIAP
jgi:hypothetical protein